MEIFGHPIYNDHFSQGAQYFMDLYILETAEFEFELTPDLKT